MPDEKVRQARFLAHVRISMTKRRTMSKNIVQSILREYGLKKPTGCNSGQWSVPGKERLRALARRLPDAVAACLEAELRLIESTTEEIEGLDERIAALSAADPEVQLLMSIPGLDYYSAFVIKSEVGDFRRFHSAKQLTCYAGLAPSVRQSGSYCVHGRITKKGRSALRWMTVECALAARRGSPKLSRFYERVRRKSRMAAKAKVATGRKILELCWHIIRSGQTYSEYDPAKYDVKLRRMRHRGGRAQKTCATGDCARGG